MSNSGKITAPVIAIWLMLWPLISISGDIVFPWRAVPEIVKSGGRFSVLFNNPDHAKIDSVFLIGPFNRLTLQIYAVTAGSFIYDTFTKLEVNNKIWVKVPKSAPEDIYDLAIYCSGNVTISKKSVKVVHKFSPVHKFIHISDPHISRQWCGTAENGYAKELELLDRFVDVANIIAPDFVLVTGDIIHHYTMFDADSTGWGTNKVYGATQRPEATEKFLNYFEGAKEFSGVQEINSPVYSLPGNHDFYGIARENYPELAGQWNKFCGIRAYGFSFAGTRVLAADNFLGDPVTDRPDSAMLSGLQGRQLEQFLEREGAGKLRILAQHRHDRCDTGFVNRNEIQLLLNGHDHQPNEHFFGTTPTLSSRPGTVCRSGEIENWQETLGFFRIFYIRKGRYEFTPPLRICIDPTKPLDQLEMNLTLSYKNPNDGNSAENDAVIRNSFPVDLPGCKVRFVMMKGEYVVQGGKVSQTLQTAKHTVVDVYTDVKADGEQKVIIQSQLVR